MYYLKQQVEKIIEHAHSPAILLPEAERYRCQQLRRIFVRFQNDHAACVTETGFNAEQMYRDAQEKDRARKEQFKRFAKSSGRPKP